MASQGRPISTYAAHAFGVKPFGRTSASVDGDPGLLARVSDDGVVTEEQAQALGAFTLVLDTEYAAAAAVAGQSEENLSSRARGRDGLIVGLGNPYHNRLHGVDVMQAANMLTRHASVGNAFDDVVYLAVLLAAMVHDFRHPGFNEKYLIEKDHPLTIRYSDDSTLERMHLAEVFELLAKPGHDWLRVAKDVRRSIRTVARLVDCLFAANTPFGRSSTASLAPTSHGQDIISQSSKATSTTPPILPPTSKRRGRSRA